MGAGVAETSKFPFNCQLPTFFVLKPISHLVVL